MNKPLTYLLVSSLTILNVLLVIPTLYAQPEETTREELEQAIEQPPIGILPRITNPNIKGNYICTLLMQRFEDIYFFELDNVDFEGDRGTIKRFTEATYRINQLSLVDGAVRTNDILGCSLITGRIKMAYLSLFIFYILRLTTVIATTTAIMFVMVGGYKYITGAITENKDEGKRTIMYAIVGLVVSTLAWVIVNIVQTLVTS